MAAATADREAQRSAGLVKSYPMAASRIYKGTLVSANASGYAKAGGDTSGERFLGVAVEQKDNSGGAAGDRSLRVEKSGEYELSFSGTATQADVGKRVFIVDDSTVALSSTNNIGCGYLTEVISGSRVRVRIDRDVQ